MKGLILPGHKEMGLCNTCQAPRSLTYGYHPFEADFGVVDNVMQGICDVCGHAVYIAPQSAHRIRQSSPDAPRRRKFRLPLELADYIAMQLSGAGFPGTETATYLQALFQGVFGHEASIGEALRRVSDAILDRPADESINLTLTEAMDHMLDVLGKMSAVRTPSEVLRRLIVLSDTDPGMKKRIHEQLKRVALVSPLATVHV